MNKLYRAKTSNGHVLIEGVPLKYLEVKLEFSLNDLVEAEQLERGEKLTRKLRIKTESELYRSLYLSSKKGQYLVTIEREF